MHDSELIEDALRAARDTRRVLIGANVLPGCVELFRSQFADRAAVIVADANTFAAAGGAVSDLFRRAGHACVEPFVFADPDLYAEHKFVAQLEESLAGHDAIPVAVGSGTINDLTKLAAHRASRPYLAVATAASMDGYTAFGASITHHGSKQTFDCPAPRAVLADLDVIARAPTAMNAWGYADLLAKITAGADWIVADELGVEPIDDRAWRMVQGRLREWVGDAAGVRRGHLGALESLVCGLMMSGFAMQATCSSRPASGAEHQFSHLWDMEHHQHNGAPPAHGAKVGIATIAVAKLYESLANQPLESIDVESLVRKWPDQSLRHLDGLFESPELLEKARLETSAKQISREQLRAQLNLLRERWPNLKMRLTEHLISPAQLAQMLADAGAPNQPEQIGISWPRLRRSFHQARMIRRRFTVLDLAARTDTLNSCLDEMFASN